HSEVIVKNGSNGVGTPKFRCKACSRQFVEHPKNPRVTDAEKDLIDRLLLEKRPRASLVH
ncbi:IS1/IS1595 family N-terminal zinc-binding domain-containing protein, partial [Methylomagnum sp.]